MRDAQDWALGIGLGRLPAHFTRSVPGYEFPGAVELEADASGWRAVRISGPPTLQGLEGLYALTQRVAVVEGVRYRVGFDVRAQGALGALLSVCTMRLLYETQCQSASVEIAADAAAWQHLSVPLEGPTLQAGSWFAPRMAVFGVSVLGAGASAKFSNFDLRAGDSGPLLRNGDFSRDLAQWFPSAQRYFVPWHIDNLYLELLIERGLPALLGFVVLAAWILKRLAMAPGRAAELAPFLAASMSGVLMIGLLSSVMDAPRTAFLLYFLVGFSALRCVTRWTEEPQAPALGNPVAQH
jgi:hypothetical protein